MKDLDFNDISGSRETIKKSKTTTSKKSESSINPEFSRKTGIILPVPTRNKREWTNKDLSDMTGEEFVEWARGVYPIDLTDYIEYLEHLDYKIGTFNGILSYHTTCLFAVGKENTSNNIVH